MGGEPLGARLARMHDRCRADAGHPGVLGPTHITPSSMTGPVRLQGSAKLGTGVLRLGQHSNCQQGNEISQRSRRSPLRKNRNNNNEMEEEQNSANP